MEHLHPVIDQALVAHRALVRAGQTEQAHDLVLRILAGYFDRRGLYRTLVKEWLPPLLKSANPATRAIALNWLGKSWQTLGDYDRALDYLKQSLAIRREIGDKKGESVTLNNISNILQARGDYDTALEYSKQDLAICREIGDKQGEGTTLNNLATLSHARGDYDTALDYLKQSLAILREIGDQAGLCATLFNIGHIHMQKQEVQEAMSAWLHVYLIARQIGNAQALQALEGLAKQLGQPGLSFWEQLARRAAPDANGDQPK